MPPEERIDCGWLGYMKAFRDLRRTPGIRTGVVNRRRGGSVRTAEAEGLRWGGLSVVLSLFTSCLPSGLNLGHCQNALSRILETMNLRTGVTPPSPLKMNFIGDMSSSFFSFSLEGLL